MSKQVTVAGVNYDSRTIVDKLEKLKLPNHPNVEALAIPQFNGNEHKGTLKVVVKIPFGRIAGNAKEMHFEIPSPRRIDAIKAVVDRVKSCTMYRRVSA